MRISNISTFFVQASTAACLSMCTKLCARLCICIGPVALQPTGVVCQNFPREFHRRMRHELSFRFVPLYESAVVFSLVVTVLLPILSLSLFLSLSLSLSLSSFFQYLPLSGFHKNNGFRSSKRRERAWYRRVHRSLSYILCYFPLWCAAPRKEGKLCSNSTSEILRS